VLERGYLEEPEKLEELVELREMSEEELLGELGELGVLEGQGERGRWDEDECWQI